MAQRSILSFFGKPAAGARASPGAGSTGGGGDRESKRKAADGDEGDEDSDFEAPKKKLARPGSQAEKEKKEKGKGKDTDKPACGPRTNEEKPKPQAAKKREKADEVEERAEGKHEKDRAPTSKKGQGQGQGQGAHEAGKREQKKSVPQPAPPSGEGPSSASASASASPATSPRKGKAAAKSKPKSKARPAAGGGDAVEEIEEVAADADAGGGSSGTEEDARLARPQQTKLPPRPAPPAAPAPAPASPSAPASAVAGSGTISVAEPRALFRGGGFGGHSLAPPNRGRKALPQGAPHCLFGLTFAFTGVLDSLEREEAAALVEQYGAKVMKTVGKRLQFLVAGLEAGPSKLRKAEESGATVIDEDALLQMIATRPAQALTKAQQAKLPQRQDPTAVAPAVPNPPAAPASPARPPPAPRAPSLSPASGGSAAKREGGAAREQGQPAESAGAEEEEEVQLWVDKYAPQRVEDVVGNAAAVARLEAWLRGWRPGRSGAKRAALLSGPPGIGKTTSAHLVARKLGYRVLETNASDARSKGALAAFAASTSTTSLHQFFGERSAAQGEGRGQRVLVVMDEVDGMSSGDRGGMRELVALVDRSEVPIVCVCNDAKHPKVRTLAAHCEDIKFRRPTLQDLERRAYAVAKAERVPESEFPRIRALLQQCNGDVRHALNVLQAAYPRAGPGHRHTDTGGAAGRKDAAETSVFELVPALFRYPAGASLDERIDAYFVDDLLVPLMIYECYLAAPAAAARDMRPAAAAMESMSESDLLARAIRRDQLFALAPAHAVLSTVRPCHAVRGGGVAPRFPALLGKMSASNKRFRLLKELQSHMTRHASANKLEVGLDYLHLLELRLSLPLLPGAGTGGVGEVLETMEAYGLTREDWTTVMELAQWSRPDGRPADSPAAAVPGQAKSQLTAAYKRLHPQGGVSLARATPTPNVLFEDGDVAVQGEGEGDEGLEEPAAGDEGEGEGEGQEDIARDKLIKEVKRKARAPAKAAAKKGGRPRSSS